MGGGGGDGFYRFGIGNENGNLKAEGQVVDVSRHVGWRE